MSSITTTSTINTSTVSSSSSENDGSSGPTVAPSALHKLNANSRFNPLPSPLHSVQDTEVKNISTLLNALPQEAFLDRSNRRGGLYLGASKSSSVSSVNTKRSLSINPVQEEEEEPDTPPATITTTTTTTTATTTATAATTTTSICLERTATPEIWEDVTSPTTSANNKSIYRYSVEAPSKHATSPKIARTSVTNRSSIRKAAYRLSTSVVPSTEPRSSMSDDALLSPTSVVSTKSILTMDYIPLAANGGDGAGEGGVALANSATTPVTKHVKVLVEEGIPSPSLTISAISTITARSTSDSVVNGNGSRRKNLKRASTYHKIAGTRSNGVGAATGSGGSRNGSRRNTVSFADKNNVANLKRSVTHKDGQSSLKEADNWEDVRSSTAPSSFPDDVNAIVTIGDHEFDLPRQAATSYGPPIERVESLKDWEEAKKDLRKRKKKKEEAIGVIGGGAVGKDVILEVSDGEATTDDEAMHSNEPKFKVKGTAITKGHPNYVLMYNMLTGIRIAVSRMAAKADRDLVMSDFEAAMKITFDVTGEEVNPSSTKFDFKFKDYSPWVFRELRSIFGITPHDYLVSLTSRYILSELGSPGKSGSFFYFSQDYKFIIKTVHHAELKFFRKILKYYYEHIKNNPNTLISRFYGLHRIRMPHGPKIHFVVMSNIFPPNRDIHETYDLKGSLVGRQVDEDKLKKNPTEVMKDLNWLARERKLELGPERRDQLVKQLQMDVSLLERLNIMDYSLLIGLHDTRRGNKENIRQNTLSVFQPEKTALAAAAAGIPLGNAAGADMRRKKASAVLKAVAETAPTNIQVINDNNSQVCVFQQDEGGYFGTDEQNQTLDMLYYLGIIDILTPYTTGKRIEHYWRALANDSKLISAVDPKLYARRFLNFMVNAIRAEESKELDDSPPSTPPVPTSMAATTTEDPNSLGVQVKVKLTKSNSRRRFRTP